MKTTTQKILQFPLTKLTLGFLLMGLVYGLLGKLIFDSLPETIFNLNIKDSKPEIVSVIASLLVLISYLYFFRLYEKRKITELSTKGMGKSLGKGLLLGMFLQALTLLIIAIVGEFKIVSVNPLYYIVFPLMMAFGSSVFEEILFRGVIFRIIEEKLGSYIALIISAAIFGFAHLANPETSIFAAIGIAVQAGVLLGAAYIYSRNLWLPIAIHFGWNFLESAMGTNVSGNSVKSLFVSETIGKGVFVNGGFGPEDTLQATVFCFIIAIVFLVLSHRQNKIIKPFWKC